MAARKFASNQLLTAEDELMLLTHWADDVGVQLGVLADEIHFDGKEPAACDGLLKQIEQMQVHLNRAKGLVLAYEIARTSKTQIREAHNDDAGVSAER
jgi:hypothetical protein